MKSVTTNTMMLTICVVPPDLCACQQQIFPRMILVPLRAVLWENDEDWVLTSIRMAGN